MKFLFRTFYQDGAVGQGEGHASDVRVIKGLPTVRLVSHYLHPLQYSAKYQGAAVQAGVALVGGVEAGVAGVAGVGTDGGVKARVRLTIQGEVQSVKLRDEVANVPLRSFGLPRHSVQHPLPLRIEFSSLTVRLLGLSYGDSSRELVQDHQPVP